MAVVVLTCIPKFIIIMIIIMIITIIIIIIIMIIRPAAVLTWYNGSSLFPEQPAGQVPIPIITSYRGVKHKSL